MLSSKSFYFIEGAGDTVHFNTVSFKLGPMPLIWNNNGLYGIIIKERVENLIDALNDRKNLPILDFNKSVGVIHWDEVKLLDSKIGKLLMGE